MRILAGDIGGTKVLLQLAKFERGKFRLVKEQRFKKRGVFRIGYR